MDDLLDAIAALQGQIARIESGETDLSISEAMAIGGAVSNIKPTLSNAVLQINAALAKRQVVETVAYINTGAA